MFKLINIIAIYAFVLSSAQARSVRAIFLQPPKNAPESAFLFSGTQSLEIKLPTRNLSKSVDLPKGPLSLAVLSNPLSEGQELPEQAQIIKIPQEWKNCILVFIPNQKNTVFPAKVLPIDASNAKFPLGGTMIYNLTNSKFIGQFGSKNVQVKPWKSKQIKTKPKEGVMHYPVVIDYVDKTTKKRSAITRTNWMHHPKARQILFVTRLENQKVPRVWGVLDHRIEKPDEG